LAQYIKNEFRKANILISTDGPFDNVLKSKPPLCFSIENAKSVVDCLEGILSEYSL
jgi:4-aminobutyrate aminotransferase-like enzyme